MAIRFFSAVLTSPNPFSQSRLNLRTPFQARAMTPSCRGLREIWLSSTSIQGLTEDASAEQCADADRRRLTLCLAPSSRCLEASANHIDPSCLLPRASGSFSNYAASFDNFSMIARWRSAVIGYRRNKAPPSARIPIGARAIIMRSAAADSAEVRRAAS